MTSEPQAQALRPYQHDAVEAAVAEISHGGRATVVMACGTGKTFVFQHVAEKVTPEPGRVLVLAPSLALVEQTYKSWAQAAGRDFTAAVFCTADPDPAAPEDVSADEVEAPMVTTDPIALAAWDAEHADEFRVVFGTYASSPNLTRQPGREALLWDLIVFDEAHRTTGTGARAYSTALHDDLIPAARRLFCTATPRVHTSSRDTDDAVASMDDEDLYGRHVYTYTFARAIEDGWLSDYVVCVVAVDDTAPEVAALATGAQAVRIGGGRAVSSANVARAAAILRAAEQYDLHRVVTFHNRVATARQFAQIMPAVADLTDTAPTVTARTTNGTMTSYQRRLALDTLRQTEDDHGIHILTNARVLAEGVDVPTLDAVVFADPRTSPVEVTQIVGRAIRRNPDRTHPAVILVPVIIGPGDDVEERLNASDFRGVHQTIRALAEHDETLLPDLARAAPAEDTKGTQGRRPHLQVITTGLDTPDATGPADDLDWTRHLHTFAIANTGASWYERAREYTEFVAQHGRHPSRKSRDEAERSLGEWVKSRRSEAKKGTLAPEKKEWLDEHISTWRGNRQYSFWERAQKYTEFVAQHGRRPSQDSSDEAERSLGTWVYNNRAEAKKGALAPEKQEWLDENVSGWRGVKRLIQFPERVRMYTEFVAQHGRCPSRKSRDEAERSLGEWVLERRKDAKKGTLAPERRAMLDERIPGWMPESEAPR